MIADSSSTRRFFPLGRSFAFEGVSLQAGGAVSIGARKFAPGEDFSAYSGPWFVYRPVSDPTGLAVQRDQTEHELEFRYRNATWLQARVESRLPSHSDLAAIYPKLRRLVLGQNGEVTLGDLTVAADEPIAVEGDEIRVLKSRGAGEPLMILADCQLPDIYLFENRQWCEWSSWLPPSKTRPPRREPNESYEPDSSPGIPGVTLHAGGEFSANDRWFRQDSAEFVVVPLGSWTLSKAAGADAELRFTQVAPEEQISYRFLNRRWHRHFYWTPAPVRPLGEVVFFQPGGVHVVPLLERYHHAEAVRCVCEAAQGSWRINKPEGEREILRVRTPGGDERLFVFQAAAWHELVRRKLHPASGQSLPELPTRPGSDQAKREVGFHRQESEPLHWVERPHPDFGRVMRPGSGPAGFFFPETRQIIFHFDGRLTVGNECFEPDEIVERDYYRTYVNGCGETELAIWRCMPVQVSDENINKPKEKWTADRFRYRNGMWQRQVVFDPTIYRNYWRHLRRFKDWAIRSGRRIVEWIDRKLFFD